MAAALAPAPAVAQKPGQIEVRHQLVEPITNTQITSSHHRGVGAIVGGPALNPLRTASGVEAVAGLRCGNDRPCAAHRATVQLLSR